MTDSSQQQPNELKMFSALEQLDQSASKRIKDKYQDVFKSGSSTDDPSFHNRSREAREELSEAIVNAVRNTSGRSTGRVESQR